MPLGDLAKKLALAVDVAQEAGQMLRAEFHRSGGPRGSGDHADVDLEVERCIRVRLLEAFPESGYLGEETGSTGMEPRPSFIWLVDPNDGTRNFLQGARGASVSIGLLYERLPVLGVVYSPCAPDDSGDLFRWAEGCGPVTRNGVPLAPVSSPTTLQPDDRIALSQDVDQAPEATLRAAAPARYFPFPSIAYRLALAAAGDALVGSTVKGARAWDYGGGHALLRGVGAEFFDHEGATVRYSDVGMSQVGRCFGGPASVVPALLGRPWDAIYGPAKAVVDAHTFHPLTALERGRSVADPRLLSRAQGCLLGQLAGDSLGYLLAATDPATRGQRLTLEALELADGGSPGPLAGQPSGASELALILGRCLVRSGRYDPSAVAEGYAYWRRETALEPGDQSSVALVRVGPLGIWGHRDATDAVADAARAYTALTDARVLSQELSAAFAVAVAHAVGSGGTPHSVYDFTHDWLQRSGRSPEARRILGAAADQGGAAASLAPGPVEVAFRCAFHELLHASSAEEGITRTLRRGGGMSANAAAVGALLGAVHGRGSVPPGWRSAVLTARPLQGLATVHCPRPMSLWPCDAMELAERLLLAGS